MTTPFALGAVTAVLRSRLTASLAASGASASVGGVLVTALPPDRLSVGAQEQNRINLFLHHVSRNPGWANVGPPPRSPAGDVVATPPLALDLHYVVSAYGQDPLTAEILLGHAVATFNDEPVLTRAAIRRSLAPSPPDPSIPPSVASSRLADQVELLRLCATNPGTEEVARVWSAFMSPYRPSAFYDVSVVLIDVNANARSPLPVAAVGSAAIELAIPEVDSVTALGAPGTPITAGSTLVITGRSLAGPGVTVRLGSSAAPPTSIRDSELQVAMVDFDPPPRAGLLGLTVTHDVDVGVPPTAHAAAVSDPVPLRVQPVATFGGGAVQISGSATVDGVVLRSGTITAGIAPPVGRDQQVLLTLTEVGAPDTRPARGAILRAPAQNGVPPNATSAANVTFPFVRVPQGPYVARLVVDGVDSPVGRAGDGTFDSPAVTL
jgi:hypothetical protein